MKNLSLSPPSVPRVIKEFTLYLEKLDAGPKNKHFLKCWKCFIEMSFTKEEIHTISILSNIPPGMLEKISLALCVYRK